jgi:hypothetical protein
MLELSLESYSKLTDGIEAKLDEADFVAENETRRYSHDEVFSRLRGKING